MKGIRPNLTVLYNDNRGHLVNLIRSYINILPLGSLDPKGIHEVRDYLIDLFSAYNDSRLVGISKDDFYDHILKQLGSVNGEVEGYKDNELEYQRDLTLKFHWGHTHDFGTMEMKGRMGLRHINIMARFISALEIDASAFEGKNVLDVGCWTGGTALLLAAMGSNVVSIEEVNKYANMASFLIRSFGLNERVKVNHASIYECDSEDYFNKFDIVYCPGVIYHLSDPLVALRILYNSLVMEGFVLIESAGINSIRSVCKFEGSERFGVGSKEEMNRGGWTWFLPSQVALRRMMKEAGFQDIRIHWHDAKNKIYCYGKKTKWKGICKSGLSNTNI